MRAGPWGSGAPEPAAWELGVNVTSASRTSMVDCRFGMYLTPCPGVRTAPGGRSLGSKDDCRAADVTPKHQPNPERLIGWPLAGSKMLGPFHHIAWWWGCGNLTANPFSSGQASAAAATRWGSLSLHAPINCLLSTLHPQPLATSCCVVAGGSIRTLPLPLLLHPCISG